MYHDHRIARACRLLIGALALAAAAALPATAAVRVPAADLIAKLHWRSIGPWIGGRVVAVAGVPGRNVFYMGATGGGIWKSTDYGIAWKNISDGTLPSASGSIGALAIAPSNPNVIYAGSGESDIRGDVITGDGVYRSNDAGRTWHYAGLRHTHTIGALLIDPHNPNVVYAASMGHVFKPNAARGVFKTTDGGKHWQRVLFTDANTGAIALAMAPSAPNVLYAAMWQAYRTPWTLSSGGPGSGIYKSVDAGAHWRKISSNPGFARGTLGRMGVAVSPADPNVVYAIVQAKAGGVFRSSNGGATWTRVYAKMNLRQRAFYYMSVYADPRDPNTVYVPEVDALWVSHDGGKHFSELHTPHGDNHIVWIDPTNPRILLEGNDGGATVSTDGGRSWSTEHNQPTGQFYHVAIDNRFPYHVYGAQQDEGSMEGPTASSYGAIRSAQWHPAAYGESSFVAPQPNDPNVTYGSGYFSIFLRYDRTTGEYSSVSPWPNYEEGASSGELRYRFGWTHPILFSPADPRRLLIASQYVLQSADSGQTWKRISPDLTRNVKRTEAPSGGPIDLDQSGAEIFPDISALAVSPLDGKTIWAGSADGLVHVSEDGGAHWKAVTPPGLPQWAEITSIQPSYAAPQTAYLSASRYMWDDFHPYVFETTDDGAHWTRITRGLAPDEYVFAVRADPNEPRLLFAGTKNTVYVSFDGGNRWQPLTLNLPRAQVRDLAVDSREGEVAIATHGRSFWVLDDLALLEQIARGAAVDATAPYLFAPQTAWLTHAYGAGGYHVPDAGTNPPFGATIFFSIPHSYTGGTPVSLTVRDEHGAIVHRFALHQRPRSLLALPTASFALPPHELAHLEAVLHAPHALDAKGWPTAASMVRLTPAERSALARVRQRWIHAGMNRIQWNLRYPSATEVNGFYRPVSAGGLPDRVDGPTVIPGTYTVALTYGGTTATAPLAVTLDPRLHPGAGALAARLALERKIHRTLDRLDRQINAALAVRDALAQRPSNAATRAALARLERAVDALVQFKIASSEGSLLHETKLRSHLAYLAATLDMAYLRPNAAEYAVYTKLASQAAHGEARIARAVTAAQALLAR